jgi:dolichol kinase
MSDLERGAAPEVLPDVAPPPPEPAAPAVPVRRAPSATRTDLQLGRRLIHMANGSAIATAYALLFTHQQIVHVFGAIACIVYILDRVRIHYPELVARAPWINTLFFRAEEEFKESAMTPYAIAILLTLLTFPKAIALIAIYTLAIADPLSALVGISCGRRRVVQGKTLEGSAAFLAATAVIAAVVLRVTTVVAATEIVAASLAIGLAGAVFEMLPLRLDDNLTIPLFVGFAGWVVCALVGIAPG